ncbi:CDP-diacylglycerol--serine O-phosphatidyltransferase [Teredinibacter sp. KSP-S5-2]|uniref:CDP-diacylglycerol--serine O-phosphatidyltransferase n=1 Tax=Teredinibacter sp. KSP-S5-2 TaxID=3034506 RepID=UPI002934E29A|nr:CDP-diacylglycerol--serine O-phosphatidyltransferase [Teredinibacter sp. KSP-S5-2]WNO09883.1 CDP-diacylglycerol--serine O-phosphatidyltransferase [Teredinibacter sp. KSP-S5-2]
MTNQPKDPLDETQDIPSIVTDNLPIDEHEEEVSEGGQTVRRRGVYLLPNLFTTGALFGGFFAIVSAMNGNFANAALAIFAAQILDGFDGRVARMTNTQSAFGTEYDSLSDMVSFGLAPAIVLFSWGLEPLGKFGWAAAFVYVTCAALRLARFNTHVSDEDKRYFTGLASPPAATLMASGVWWGSELELTTEISIFAALVTVFVGLTMVSNLKYQSFKGLDANRRVPFVAMLITLLVFILVTIDPPRVLFAMAFVYALSGPVTWLVKSCIGFFKNKKVQEEG